MYACCSLRASPMQVHCTVKSCHITVVFYRIVIWCELTIFYPINSNPYMIFFNYTNSPYVLTWILYRLDLTLSLMCKVCGKVHNQIFVLGVKTHAASLAITKERQMLVQNLVHGHKLHVTRLPLKMIKHLPLIYIFNFYQIALKHIFLPALYLVMSKSS